jgi:hypothetical protein
MANKKKLLLPEYTSELKYMAWSVTCIDSNWMIQGNLSLQYRKVSEKAGKPKRQGKIHSNKKVPGGVIVFKRAPLM